VRRGPPPAPVPRPAPPRSLPRPYPALLAPPAPRPPEPRPPLLAPGRPRPSPAPSRCDELSSPATVTDLLNGLYIQNKRAAPRHGGRPSNGARRCPTLPRGLPRSTIGAGGLNFRVRNGSGCFPFAVAAATLWSCVAGVVAVSPEPHSGRVACLQDVAVGVCQALGRLVPVSCTPCGASTSGLSTQSSGWGPYPLVVVGGLVLRGASRLDAFSGYPFRT
jgi:hypothetical protein